MTFLKSLTVYDVNSPKFRIGNERDGGYILNELIIKHTKRLISVGIGGEDQFELQVARNFPEISIEAYDGTYPCNNLCHQFPQRINKDIFYVNYNVGYKEKEIPLNNIVDYKQNVLLKVDTEGNEYTMFDNVYLNNANVIGLILEVHDLQVADNRSKLASLITEHFSDLLLFHIHGNSWGGTFDLNLLPYNTNHNIVIQNFPHVMELCFINKSLVEKYTIDKSRFPIMGLDTSNKSDSEDIDLYWVNAF